MQSESESSGSERRRQSREGYTEARERGGGGEDARRALREDTVRCNAMLSSLFSSQYNDDCMCQGTLTSRSVCRRQQPHHFMCAAQPMTPSTPPPTTTSGAGTTSTSVAAKAMMPMQMEVMGKGLVE